MYQPSDVMIQAKDPVARVLKREVIEATENHPIRLREVVVSV